MLFISALKFADGDEFDLREKVINIAELWLVHVMQGVHELAVHIPREHQARNVMQMDDVAIAGGIGDGPRSVVEVFQVVENLTTDRPLLLLVQPALLHSDSGFAVGVHHHIDAGGLQTFGQLCDEQFRSAILCGGTDRKGGETRATLIR